MGQQTRAKDLSLCNNGARDRCRISHLLCKAVARCFNSRLRMARQNVIAPPSSLTSVRHAMPWACSLALSMGSVDQWNVFLVSIESPQMENHCCECRSRVPRWRTTVASVRWPVEWQWPLNCGSPDCQHKCCSPLSGGRTSTRCGRPIRCAPL